MRGTTQASGVVGPSESTISSKEGLDGAPGSRQGKDQKHKEFIEMENKNSPFIIIDNIFKIKLLTTAMLQKQ
jgi:hypothetical protein